MNDDFGKFKNASRFVNRTPPRLDRELVLPETLRNQARQEEVDNYLKSNPRVSRRMARRLT